MLSSFTDRPLPPFSPASLLNKHDTPPAFPNLRDRLPFLFKRENSFLIGVHHTPLLLDLSPLPFPLPGPLETWDPIF